MDEWVKLVKTHLGINLNHIANFVYWSVFIHQYSNKFYYIFIDKVQNFFKLHFTFFFFQLDLLNDI